MTLWLIMLIAVLNHSSFKGGKVLMSLFVSAAVAGMCYIFYIEAVAGSHSS